MRLVIQIPCYNEQNTLPLVLESIPQKIKGITSIEVLVIDDGSTDRTLEIAREHGVRHFIIHKRNRGLAKTFYDGLQEALRLGADIIVNTDGDNQYPQGRIPDLIQPIIDGKAEVVIADRQTQAVVHFSPLKKYLQKFGSRIVNMAAGTKIPDAVSGFRAYSRAAAMELNVVTEFSYCTETIIQAGNKRLAMASVRIKTNPKTRESRLFKNMRQHIFKSMLTIIRSYLMHKPFKIFVSSGLALAVLGILPFIRFVALTFIAGDPLSGHIQSLLVGAVIMILGVIFIALGFIGELIAINRKLLEDALQRMRRLEYNQKND